MKKKVEKEKSVKEEVGLPPTGTGEAPILKKEISKLEIDFGRADLNQMRDKINEIIENGN